MVSAGHARRALGWPVESITFLIRHFSPARRISCKKSPQKDLSVCSRISMGLRLFAVDCSIRCLRTDLVDEEDGWQSWVMVWRYNLQAGRVPGGLNKGQRHREHLPESSLLQVHKWLGPSCQARGVFLEGPCQGEMRRELPSGAAVAARGSFQLDSCFLFPAAPPSGTTSPLLLHVIASLIAEDGKCSPACLDNNPNTRNSIFMLIVNHPTPEQDILAHNVEFHAL